jgi:hypothetical protein
MTAEGTGDLLGVDAIVPWVSMSVLGLGEGN